MSKFDDLKTLTAISDRMSYFTFQLHIPDAQYEKKTQSSESKHIRKTMLISYSRGLNTLMYEKYVMSHRLKCPGSSLNKQKAQIFSR